MFNLGGDDKEKLKENMEEIKDLVNSQHGQNQQNSASPDSTNPSPPQERPEPDIPEEIDTELDNTETGEPETREEQDDFKSSSERFGSSSDGDLKNDLESISNEVKKLEGADKDSSHGKPVKPSGSGETVFLEVDEFQDVKGKVEEMRYLSREMKDLVGNLEEGVDEDRRIESEAQDVLDDFTDRRESIQSSIK